jgi:2-methylcitrate dehydratase
MNTPSIPEYRDEVADLLANFVVRVSRTLDAAAARSARNALIDSLAVSVAGFSHPAAKLARRHAYRFPSGGEGCLIWGTDRRVAPDLAALTNGVLLRCHDYNDFFVGARNSGHPSDMVGGVIAAAEWADASGERLMAGIAVGYEVVAAMFDALSTAPGGWDYTNLTAIGATAAIATVLGLDAEQAREAFAMTVVPHLAADEIESGDLNKRGDLTMWKRFNGSDAVRNSLQACLLAQVGIEGAVRPFVGNFGFLKKLANAGDPLPVLRERLDPALPLTRITQTFMKRWPVGSVAQSAIQAALQARAQLADIGAIKQVRVFAEEGAYEHLVKIRQDPFHPISRETADHSLPYIVAAAVLDGEIGIGSFSPQRVLEPRRQAFLAQQVTVAAAPELGTLAGGKLKRAEAGYLSRVEIETMDGRVVHGKAAPFPGHPKNPFSDADLDGKLRENVEPVAGPARTAELASTLRAIEGLRSVRQLTALLVLETDIDALQPID